MRRVVVISPFAGDIVRNLRYLRAAMADCFARGEAPFASHGLFTQPGVLDDSVPAQREIGIKAGHAWIRTAEICAVYFDIGISVGMSQDIAFARAYGVPLENRSVAAWPEILRMHEEEARQLGEMLGRRSA